MRIVVLGSGASSSMRSAIRAVRWCRCPMRHSRPGCGPDAARLRVQKKDSGLTLSRLAGDLIGRDLSLDTRACGSAIGLTPRSLDAETVATVAACR